LRLPNWITLCDISSDGRTLVSINTLRSSLRALPPGETRERDLSWHEGSLVKALTPDGKTMLFDEGSEGYFHTVYVRPTDGSPAKRLGEGRAMAISPDGQWVVANVRGRGSKVMLLPTGAGEPRILEDETHRFEEAAFFPDGKRILLLGKDPGHGARTYVRDIAAGVPRPIAPEGVFCRALSPDGKEAACRGPRKEGVIYSIDGGAPREIPGFRANEAPLLWSSDGRSLFVGVNAIPSADRNTDTRVYRLDLTTGKRELWREFTPADKAGVLGGLYQFAMTPDGRSYAYSFLSALSDLYFVTGLK